MAFRTIIQKFNILLIIILLASIIFLSAFTNNKAKEQLGSEEKLITVKLIESGTILKAKIISLEDAAKNIGLDQMQIHGSAERVPMDIGNKTKYNITWRIAALQDNTTSLDKPFISALIVEGELDINTDFNAKGDTESLIQAFNRLKSKPKVQKDHVVLDNRPVEVAPNIVSPSNTPITNESPKTVAGAPEFKVKDPVILVTSDGCEIKIDIAQNVAIVQERVLTDNVQTSPCGESLTKYPLTKIYSSCDVHEDIGALKAYEQATLGYDDPISGARIQVQDCTPDLDKAMDMIEQVKGCQDAIRQLNVAQQSRLIYRYKGNDIQVRECQPTDVIYPIDKIIDSCGIRDDITKGVSYQQVKESYIKDGNIIILPGSICQDDISAKYNHIQVIDDCEMRHDFENNISYMQKRSAYIKDDKTIIVASGSCQDDIQNSYDHVVTRDTCDPQITGNEVLLSSRKYITSAASRLYITQCAPDASVIALQEEACADMIYTNDYTAGVSYPNKTYFYVDNGHKVIVTSCVADNNISFTHFKEACAAQHNDAQKTSQAYVRTYITPNNQPDNNEKIFLTDCVADGKARPYTRIGDRWKKISQTTQTINVPNSNITLSVNNTGWRRHANRYGYWYYSNTVPGGVGLCGENFSVITNGYWCITGAMPNPLTTINGLNIDLSYSDQRPQRTLASTSSSCTTNSGCEWGEKLCTGGTHEYRCNLPTCLVTTLSKQPVYSRFDGSQYIDINSATGTKHVCGTGSLLDGVMQ